MGCCNPHIYLVTLTDRRRQEGAIVLTYELSGPVSVCLICMSSQSITTAYPYAILIRRDTFSQESPLPRALEILVATR